MATIQIPAPLFGVEGMYDFAGGYSFYLTFGGRRVFHKFFSEDEVYGEYNIAESRFMDIVSVKFENLLED